MMPVPSSNSEEQVALNQDSNTSPCNNNTINNKDNGDNTIIDNTDNRGITISSNTDKRVSSISDTTDNLEQKHTSNNTDNGDNGPLSNGHDRIIDSPLTYPSAPPNSAVPRKIRLVHSAPKSNSRSNLLDDIEDLQVKEKQQWDDEKPNEQHVKTASTESPASPKSVYTPVYFQIAQSKDITVTQTRRGEDALHKQRSLSRVSAANLDRNILNYKPGFSRQPSPKKVKFLENNQMNKAKSCVSLTSKSNTAKKERKDAESVLTASFSDSSKLSERSRKNLLVSQCEAVPISDLKKRYEALNKTLSKSAQVLNIAPRPIAAFPSKPLKAGSFVLARRNRGKSDTQKSRDDSGEPSMTNSPTSHLSISSVEKAKKSPSAIIASTETESSLPALEDLNIKDRSGTHQLLDKSSDFETPAPLNSCKTSIVGSDVLLPPESVLATRGTMRPWSGTMEEASDVRSELSSTARTESTRPTTRSAASTKMSSLGLDEELSESHTSSTRVSSSRNAFRPSKSVHMLNVNQAYANYNAKNKGVSSSERHKAFIMDMFKKSGLKAPILNNSPYNSQRLNEERKYTGYSGFREGRKQKQRSRSLGRDDSGNSCRTKPEKFAEEIGSTLGNNQRNSTSTLSILASHGGRDVLFKSSTKFVYRPLNKEQPDAKKQGVVVGDKPIASSLKSTDTPAKEKPVSQPSVTFEEDIHEKVDEPSARQARLQGTSSFRKINRNLATEMIGYSQTMNGGEAMFDASHYEGFQHAKFNRRNLTRNNNISNKKPAGNTNTYSDDLKNRFLKVSVGGVGTGIPSETMESPRSSEITTSSTCYQ